MSDDEEAVQQAESCGRNGKEVHGGDGFAMVAKKSQPAPRRLWSSGRPFHPARDGSLGNVEAQHAELAMDARGAPSGVLLHHAVDQVPDFLRYPLSAKLLSHPRDHAPVEAKAGTVPAHHCLRCYEDERLPPWGPKAASEHPEEFVDPSKSGPGMLALQGSQLLPQRQILKE